MSKAKAEEEKTAFPEDWGGSEFDSGKSGMLPHTPYVNNPPRADQVRGDPRIDGPYLDDIREAQAAESRRVKDAEAKKFVEQKRLEAEARLAASANITETSKSSAKEKKLVEDKPLNPALTDEKTAKGAAKGGAKSKPAKTGTTKASPVTSGKRDDGSTPVSTGGTKASGKK